MNWEILGLNKYESNAYEAITKIGKGTAAKISKTSEVPYGRIYDILESLINKNLIRIIPGHPKTYTIADPSIINKIIKNKEKKFDEVKEEIKKLKRIYEKTPSEAVMVATGKKAWYELSRELRKKPQKISYKIKYSSEYFPEWVREEKKEISKGVDVKTLTKYNEETKENIKKWLKINKNIKKYDNNGVSFWIGDNFVLFALIKSNASVLIQDKAFVEIIKQLFKDAYKNAEKIKT